MGKFLYLEAKRKIVEMIQGGDFGSNDKILSERELADILGYSRMTVKKAIGSLVEDGVLYKKRGAGTFLSNEGHSNRFEVGDESPLSLTQGIRIKGMESSSFVESFKLVYDDPELMAVFPEYFEFFELIRVREANEDKVSLQIAYFPFRLFKDAHRYDFGSFSLYDYMEYKNKRPVKFKKQLYASRVEDEKQFSKINMRPGEYVLCIEYCGYTDQNELVEYTKSFFNPEKITFNVETDY